MTKFNVLSATLALLLGSAIFAADISGKWTGKVPVRGGDLVDATFVFKVEGGKLTGTVNGIQGEQPIVDGKVEGDSISFAVDSERGKQQFKGTLAGSELKMSREGRNGPREFTAKRAQ